MLFTGNEMKRKREKACCMVAIVSVVQIMDQDLINGTRNDGRMLLLFHLFRFISWRAFVGMSNR